MKGVIKSCLILLAAEVLADLLHADRSWSVGIGWMALALRFEIDRNKTWALKYPAHDSPTEPTK